MNKVLIRPIRVEDASISWKWRNDTGIWKFTGRKPDVIVTEEIEKRWLLEKLNEKNSIRFAIEVDDIYVGNIQLTDIIENETAEYHIFIGDKSFWGKGVAQLATAQLLRYASYVTNLKSIFLTVKPENISAIKVYERAGFIRIDDVIQMKIDLSKLKTPVVSVFIMTYNHENYISEAIEGILMQRTNFDYDIVIGEDCSTDNTRNIILDYQKKFPGKFKLLLHEQNIGASANQTAVLNNCSGKYIAFCEGYDYWTDPLKLQKQVDFLEANTDCSLCFHASKSIRNNNPNDYTLHRPKEIPLDNKFEMKHAILGGGGFMATNSMVFHREYIIKHPTLMNQAPVGDFPLMLLLATKGNIGYIDEVMSVYRVKSSSTSWTVGTQNLSK